MASPRTGPRVFGIRLFLPRMEHSNRGLSE